MSSDAAFGSLWRAGYIVQIPSSRGVPHRSPGGATITTAAKQQTGRGKPASTVTRTWLSRSSREKYGQKRDVTQAPGQLLSHHGQHGRTLSQQRMGGHA